MKRLLFALPICLLCCAGSMAQSTQPYYLLFNSSCMDQLEYRYTYSSDKVMGYSVHPVANEHYVFMTGARGITAQTLPKGAVECRAARFDDALLNAVNNGDRQMYIVHQTQQGYVLMAVTSALQVVHSGVYYIFRSPKYTFTFDTTRLAYEANLAAAGSGSYVYLNGIKILNCRREYTFRREPLRAGDERADFSYIPDIGFSTERVGRTAAEAENNQLRLTTVNGFALDDYMTSICLSANAVAPSQYNYDQQKARPGAQPVAPATYTYDNRMYDKEDVSAAQTRANPYYNPSSSTATTNPSNPMPMGPQPLINCPENPGTGYHIVQPGETLNSIARAYSVTTKSLISWNKIKNPDKINICQKVWVMRPPSGAVGTITTKGSAQKPAAYSYTQPAAPIAQNQSQYWQDAAPAAYAYPNPAAPAQYSTSAPTTAGIATLRQGVVNGKTVWMHTVQSGETLSGIAKRYGYTEERVRSLNNYLPNEKILLMPGQQLIISDCDPNLPATPAATPYNTPAPATGGQSFAPLDPAPAQYNYPSNPQTARPGAIQTAPAADTFKETPVDAPYNPNNNPAANPVVKTPYYQEYIVREGDTINSIALANHISAQELALANSKEVNEVLVAGQRLLIPRQ